MRVHKGESHPVSKGSEEESSGGHVYFSGEEKPKGASPFGGLVKKKKKGTRRVLH